MRESSGVEGMPASSAVLAAAQVASGRASLSESP
jgi:hypothetical protein